MLTLDDGPIVSNGETQAVLNQLKLLGVKVTFFVAPASDWGTVADTGINDLPPAKCDMIKQMLAAGHEVQSHSWDHADFTTLTNAQIKVQLQLVSDWLYQCAGYRPTHFRPPFGNLNLPQARYINSLGYIVVLWNIDSNDWQTPGSVTKIEAGLTTALNGYKSDSNNPSHVAVDNIVQLQHDVASGPATGVFSDILTKFYAGRNFITATTCYNSCVLNSYGICKDPYTTHYQLASWGLK